MSRKIVLRRGVPDDLHDVVAYLERTSLAVADRFIEAAFRAFDQLAEMPGIGSPKQFGKTGPKGVRSWAVPGFPNHLIYYQVHAEAVIVLAVLHGIGTSTQFSAVEFPERWNRPNLRGDCGAVWEEFVAMPPREWRVTCDPSPCDIVNELYNPGLPSAAKGDLAPPPAE